MSERFEQLQDWVAGALRVRTVRLEAVSADASFRRYFRCNVGASSYVIMDAPPSQEDCSQFVYVAGLMQEAGVHVPGILAQDLTQGFLLLTDLGQRSYLDVLKAEAADRLFIDAIHSLIRWQLATRQQALPDYDRTLLHRELQLFDEWYTGRHLGITLSSTEQEILETSFRLLEDSALSQPKVFVHRDYMPRNLMVSTPNPGVLDFQDAVYGPITYDLVSLFKDAFISWDPGQVTIWQRRYWQQAKEAGLPVQDLKEFERALDWMGMQRHLKVLGIFARIYYRDDKSGYLEDTPRFMKYLRETAQKYREFTHLLRLLDSLERRARQEATRP